jgi:type III pantothenate kinase
MLFALDVGNTHMVAGIFEGETLVHHWSLSTDRRKTCDEYGITFMTMMGMTGLQLKDVTGSIISSSVPPLNPVLAQAVHKYLSTKPLTIGPGTKTGMDIKYENPKDVSPDRIANAVAAFHKYGGPTIIVDFGTGTIFDAISKAGAYLGGAIAPGILTATDSLFETASRLPRIELARPHVAIGRTTATSLQSGIVFGSAGQADGIVRRMSKELGEEARVIATGDLAEMVASVSETIEVVEPFLTLEGLNLIYQRNVG